MSATDSAQTQLRLPDGFKKAVVGYCDPLSVRAGEEVRFHLSSHTPGVAQLAVVELISGDDRPHGTGLLERVVEMDVPSELQLAEQPLRPGSYAHIADMPAIAEGVFEVLVFPTLPEPDYRCVANLAGVEVSVSCDGFKIGDVLSLPVDVQDHRWYRLELEFADVVHLTVTQLPHGVAEAVRSWEAQSEAIALPAGDWLFAARAPGVAHFNGRLEAPSIRDRTGVVAKWDFSQAIASQRIVDVAEGGAHHGALLQTPTRAVKGHSWTGTVHCFAQAPEQYGAIHFHEDDLTDAGWAVSLTLSVPENAESGQYALKINQEDSEDYVPFFVRPRAGARDADLAYLVPTATYLAYANQRLGLSDGAFGSSKIHHANDAYLLAHDEVGYSMYEHHRDGSGVHFSSRLRPVLNLKPRSTTWAFNADTHITAWLDALEQGFDIVTDEDLHREGAAALSGYRAVISGTHPEYYSTAMRDGLETWLEDGGRLMYMGGNGFYWRVAFSADNPAIMEVRRAEDGTRAWIAEPGEYYQQFNGEYGGMWRRVGKPPNELVGIGFAAQGFDGGTYYEVQPGALDARVAFAVEGIEAGDIWGDFGNQGGGAAGEEIDRHDASLGSPRHAVIIASSREHKPGMLRVIEEYYMMEPIRKNDPKVRADIVFFEVPGGGAVFSTGSISYAGSLAHNDYDNHIARLTGNVLRRFLDPQPFEMP